MTIFYAMSWRFEGRDYCQRRYFRTLAAAEAAMQKVAAEYEDGSVRKNENCYYSKSIWYRIEELEVEG